MHEKDRQEVTLMKVREFINDRTSYKYANVGYVEYFDRNNELEWVSPTTDVEIYGGSGEPFSFDVACYSKEGRLASIAEFEGLSKFFAELSKAMVGLDIAINELEAKIKENENKHKAVVEQVPSLPVDEVKEVTAKEVYLEP